MIFSRKGFSLIELLVVVSIIAVLTGATVPYVQDYLDLAKSARARSDLQEIGEAIIKFETVNSTEFSDLTGKSLLGAFLQKIPIDPWGSPYHFASVGAQGVYQISSVGPDSKSGTIDDVIFKYLDNFGMNWTIATTTAAFGPRRGHASVFFDGKILVMGGSNGGIFLRDVWGTTNGLNWTQLTANWLTGTGRVGHSAFVFGNKIFILGGDSVAGQLADALSSSDGVTWTNNPALAFGQRAYHSSVVFSSRMWLIGGQDGGNAPRNDVWSSSDGVVWNQETAGALFPARWGHTSVVFNNRIYIIGGSIGPATHFSDVWSSADGIAWRQETAKAQFPPRSTHSSVVWKNRMWVMGGEDNAGPFEKMKDTWYSKDGVHWIPAAGIAFSPGRGDHSMVVTEPENPYSRVWIMGGIQSPNLRDVLFSY